ncbi:integrase core domain-containing protein [Sphingobacterium sp. JUb78]|uniref:integrase core domain-containing protein n=1 Tax=Sphingobacterium TaxID=28453 RepID=UPI001046BB5F|nr:putative transposase [Sphingobacterium kitahiroshimense]TCR11917.1 integrase-like protein [Sphingobacterium sp. JUb78]
MSYRKDNAYIELFSGIFRDECLNTNWFLFLKAAKQKIDDWRQEYNTFRSHSCFGDLISDIFIENQIKNSKFFYFEIFLKLGGGHL